jgi:hypothetical protein
MAVRCGQYDLAFLGSYSVVFHFGRGDLARKIPPRRSKLLSRTLKSATLHDGHIIARGCYLNESISLKRWQVRLLHLAFSVGWLIAACSPGTTPTPTSGQAQQTIATAAPTLFMMPSPPPSPTAVCSDAPRNRLILHERGRVLPDDPRPINLRSAPGTDNTVLMQIPIRALFYVLEGPICADNFAWYKIRYQGREGWIAEGDLSSYYVEPYLPG